MESFWRKAVTAHFDILLITSHNLSVKAEKFPTVRWFLDRESRVTHCWDLLENTEPPCYSFCGRL